MTHNCTSAPVSWLQMEQYHLGELSEALTSKVRGHLDTCANCATSMDSIVNDSMVLKPLPEIEHQGIFDRFAFTPLRLATAGGALAALIFALLLLWPAAKVTTDYPPARIGYKGGDLAISVVRDRDGAITHEPEGFLDGDRFSIQITCPPGNRALDVAVFQGDAVYFPYDNQDSVLCANTVSIPGAFSLNGPESVFVCVIVDEIPQRARLASRGLEALPPSSVCIELDSLK